MELTHASFFSGVGGLDLGLESAGWRTVSFSEIDPYANAVLAERWPGVPNLGDILSVGASLGTGRELGRADGSERPAVGRGAEPRDAWAAAHLWTGGFPCQDLSVAGKRAGFAGERSSLAFAFLDLVERHRPPAVLLENVPGLLSSHRGRDMAALLGRLVELGYGVAYRTLDARYGGVPQRRRRIFIVGLRSEADDPDGRVAAERAAEVLSVGTRCDRHPPTGGEAWPGAADGTGEGTYLPQSINAKWAKGYSGPAGDEHHNLTLSPPPDPGGVRAPDGLAGRLDDRERVAYVKVTRPHGPDGDGERWDEQDVSPTLNSFDNGEVRTPTLLTMREGKPGGGKGPLLSVNESLTLARGNGQTLFAETTVSDDDDSLLPLGLDSHRYRCCGNGVVAPVAEWIGRRLAEALA